MSFNDTESLKINSFTFIKKYSFFVKTFILWVLISIPWNVTSLIVLNLKQMDLINGTQFNYTCYEKEEDWGSWVEDIKLWLGVIIPASIAIVGIVFNITSFIVLRKMEGNEIFKKLLMSLGMSYKIFQLK